MVGAGILDIITESLYDKPIVVFREYVQNAVDSFYKTMANTHVKKDNLFCKIWCEDKQLFFLDNGNGIIEDKFKGEMEHIAFSEKRRTLNLGYKGIGRLSGLSYCKRLSFVNILDFSKGKYQAYIIECEKYNELKKVDSYSELSFEEIMDKIGKLYDNRTCPIEEEITVTLKKNKEIFTEQNRGFLVILEEISSVLEQTISEKDLLMELGWLLPVGFKKEMFDTNEKELFEEITEVEENRMATAQGFNILYDGKQLERPIEKKMLRDYTCKFNLEYATGFITFRKSKIVVEKGNLFSGIKMYIDNMLLCDETELIPMLLKYGMLEHTSNELLQTVNGIGAIIYITDKINISANARRTFIEVTDDDSLRFLKKIAILVEKIYKVRYALSKYSTGKKSMEIDSHKLDNLKSAANKALQDLAQMEIDLSPEDSEISKGFYDLTETEKKQMIKKKLTKEVNSQIKLYLAQTTLFDYENAFKDFIIWLQSI